MKDDTKIIGMAGVCVIVGLLVLVIAVSIGHKSQESNVSKQQLKEQERQAEDDQYIDRWFHFGKDRYGNCWAFREGEVGDMISIACSNIGR